MLKCPPVYQLLIFIYQLEDNKHFTLTTFYCFDTTGMFREQCLPQCLLKTIFFIIMSVNMHEQKQGISQGHPYLYRISKDQSKFK